jgi:hypothetical protein
MDSLIQADIGRGAPFILLDGVGASFEDAVSAIACRLLQMEFEEMRAPVALRPWLRQRREAFARRYVVLDFAQPDPQWRLNVLAVPQEFQPSDVVADFLSAFERATNGELTEQRRLLQVARAVISVLVELGGTVLRDALDALAFGRDDWQTLIGYLSRKRAEKFSGTKPREDASLKYLTSFFVQLNPRDQQAVTQSTWNAFNVFLADPVVAKFLSSPVSTLDIQAILDGGKCLLIRLPPGLDVMTQSVLGSLLLNRIVLMASKRDVQAVATGKLPRVTLYIDEVASFAGKRFTQDLTRVRNWGLAVVAAAQHFQQEPWHTVEGQALYRAMRGNMGTTVLFRVGMDMALAEADAIFKPRGDMLARIENELTESEGVSDAHGTSVSQTSTFGTSSSTTVGGGQSNASANGTTWNWDGGGSTNNGFTRMDSHQSGASRGMSDSTGQTAGRTFQRSETHSRSVKLRRDYYSVEEQARVHAYALAELPARHAYVVLGNDRAETYLIRTLDVPVEWETVWGGKDYKKEFLRLAAPPEPVPEPGQSLEVRLRALIDSQDAQVMKARARRVTRGAA